MYYTVKSNARKGQGKRIAKAMRLGRDNQHNK